jgi:hypothetical protein
MFILREHGHGRKRIRENPARDECISKINKAPVTHKINPAAIGAIKFFMTRPITN